MREENLNLNTRQLTGADVQVLELNGPLLCNNLFDFQQAVRATSTRGLIIEMTHVPYVDSAGVGALVGAYVSFQRDNRRMALVSVNDNVHRLLTMTQVEKFFRIYTSLDEAQSALGLESASHGAAQS